jgi:hypothetical protein
MRLHSQIPALEALALYLLRTTFGTSTQLPGCPTARSTEAT